MKAKIIKLINDVGIPVSSIDQTIDVIKKRIGEDAEIDLVIEKYKRYIYYKKIKHHGTEDKFIAKVDKPKDFYQWVFTNGYIKELVFPKNILTDYLFDGRYEEMRHKAPVISNEFKKQRNENLKRIKSIPGI